MLDSTDCSYYSCDHSEFPMQIRGGYAPSKSPKIYVCTGGSSQMCDPVGVAGADYIGSNSDGVSNLTAPGTIYPDFKYGVWGAVAEHPQGAAPSMLADGTHSLPPDHSGAFYCT